MVKFSIAVLCLFLLFVKCQSHPEPPVGIDPDIVLVNIEQGDREFIANVLRKLDSLHPIAIGIDVTFQARKKNDTSLISALANIKNDMLVYSVDPGGKIYGSDSVFSNLTENGNLYYEQKRGLVTTIVPLQKVNNTMHESLAFKILKKWKPDSVSKIKANEKIDIHYTRDLSKFNKINGTDLIQLNADDFDLDNKIFLVGYIGPGKEDKHFTPLRIREEFKSNEPDTYGLVIIANEIRTILEYNNF